MFPILAVAYTRLAISEEREVRVRHGTMYDEYAARTPRFLPLFGRYRTKRQGTTDFPA